jgi:hypothetical protein
MDISLCPTNEFANAVRKVEFKLLQISELPRGSGRSEWEWVWHPHNGRLRFLPRKGRHQGDFTHNRPARRSWCNGDFSPTVVGGLLRTVSGSWFAPPGSNRSGDRGNEVVGASGVEGRLGDLASM